MNDSGERQQFETGAVRDAAADKPRMDLISPFAMRRLGNWLRIGANKYADRNWEKGMSFTRCIASLMRHSQSYLAGDTDEDHLAAIMCNAMFLAHYEEMIARGVLPKSLDDRPSYLNDDGPTINEHAKATFEAQAAASGVTLVELLTRERKGGETTGLGLP